MKFLFCLLASYFFILSAGAQVPGDLNSLKADHPLWVYDQKSRTSHHVSELSQITRGKFKSSRPQGYSPQQIHRAYGFDKLYRGKDKVTGFKELIAIVNAFHYPTAAADLKKFIETFNLKRMFGLPGTASCTVAAGPHPCFQVIFARGVEPTVEDTWALESALDTQWAHAIAPGADILLVEASSSNFIDLFQAVQFATFQKPSVISMSWGGPEFALQSIFEPLFNVPEISFVAAAGDVGSEPSYPATSPNVLAVGGTKLLLDKHGNRIANETGWVKGGGGISQYMAIPPYQSNFPIPFTNGFRGTPDVSYHGDPVVGVSMYTTTPFGGKIGWFTVAGTSAGAPQWAALIALADELRSNNLSTIDLNRHPEYEAAKNGLYHVNYRDIKSGTSGPCGSVCMAQPGYDFVTGLGTPRADELVWFLGDFEN